MLNQHLNPFAAILAITAIGGAGTLFVLNEIAETDFVSLALYENVLNETIAP